MRLTIFFLHTPDFEHEQHPYILVCQVTGCNAQRGQNLADLEESWIDLMQDMKKNMEKLTIEIRLWNAQDVYVLV